MNRLDKSGPVQKTLKHIAYITLNSTLKVKLWQAKLAVVLWQDAVNEIGKIGGRRLPRTLEHLLIAMHPSHAIAKPFSSVFVAQWGLANLSVVLTLWNVQVK